MGFGGWELLLVALIVVLIFGTKKLRNVGKDLGSGIKSFKDAMNEKNSEASEDKDETQITLEQNQSDDTSEDKKKE